MPRQRQRGTALWAGTGRLLECCLRHIQPVPGMLMYCYPRSYCCRCLSWTACWRRTASQATPTGPMTRTSWPRSGNAWHVRRYAFPDLSPAHASRCDRSRGPCSAQRRCGGTRAVEAVRTASARAWAHALLKPRRCCVGLARLMHQPHTHRLVPAWGLTHCCMGAAVCTKQTSCPVDLTIQDTLLTGAAVRTKQTQCRHDLPKTRCF